MSNTFRVAVFAHNEERRISRTLDSVRAACGHADDLKICVLINGCSDKTHHVVEQYAARHGQVVPVLIPLGDKAHAWNIYVYEIADSSPVHFFMDGDVECSELALCRMQEKLLSDEQFLAIAGMPLSGRNRRVYQSCIERWHLLFGNLHAVRGSQLQKIRHHAVRLPVGTWGSDHRITQLFGAATLDPLKWSHSHITYLAGVGYQFPSLKFYLPHDLQRYFNRCVNYRLRSYHLANLESFAPVELPATVDHINRKALDDLRKKRPGWLDPVGRTLLARLEQRYPASGRNYYLDHPDLGRFEVVESASQTVATRVAQDSKVCA